ncbi:hypothetical protein SCHPADRAFT_889946 [Schizopora paradoxa]|uniref:SUI1 domain-containing protein n=1 Tax=Schizopora paradoxa TaxID=27342 RepID=A0A0H2RVQ7_9AGAM|nr:hypothetical protein SCHPADRAFT_889946 [Schizopora paradoxa]
MTEAMPGPIPRQLSKKTELATIVEKNAATSSSSNTLEVPVAATTNEASSSKLQQKRPSSKLSAGDGVESSDSDEERLGTKTPKANFSARASIDDDDDSEVDDKLDSKTPRPKSPVARSPDSDGEEVGTKTPKATISLSRTQVSHHESSHRNESDELPLDEDSLQPADDDDPFDFEASLDAVYTDLTNAERDVESREEDMHIRLIQMPGRKKRYLTIFEGLGDDYDHKRLLKKLRKTFACNGNVKKSKKGNEVIILQGNHCEDLRGFLIDRDVPSNTIRMHNF